MVLRILTLTFLVLFNFICQTTLLQNIAFWGIKPNTAVLMIVSYAVLRGDVEGGLFGFFTGLLQDLFFAKYIGFHALLGACLGFLCGKPFRDYYRENVLLPVILSLFCVFFYELLFYLFHFFFQGKLLFFVYLETIILPETLYSAIMCVPIYLFMYRINKWLENRLKRRPKIYE